jgi:hypothetical protein
MGSDSKGFSLFSELQRATIIEAPTPPSEDSYDARQDARHAHGAPAERNHTRHLSHVLSLRAGPRARVND